MTNTTTTNEIRGSGQHSHLVPTVEGLVVEIRDGHHQGTAVWLRPDGTYAFATYDNGKVEIAERCVLLRGQDVEDVVPEQPYGCDLESPDGLVLIGVALDDDLSWISDGAIVLWDSAHGGDTVSSSDEYK